MKDNQKAFVVLEGIKHGNKFFTSNTIGDDPTKSATGETWYKVIGYADTIEEAQRIIWPTEREQKQAVLDYMSKTLERMAQMEAARYC